MFDLILSLLTEASDGTFTIAPEGLDRIAAALNEAVRAGRGRAAIDEAMTAAGFLAQRRDAVLATEALCALARKVGPELERAIGDRSRESERRIALAGEWLSALTDTRWASAPPGTVKRGALGHLPTRV